MTKGAITLGEFQRQISETLTREGHLCQIHACSSWKIHKYLFWNLKKLDVLGVRC